MRSLLLIAATLLVLAVPAAAATGGLHGVVFRSPTTPVCKVGSPCEAPARGVKLTFVRNGVSESVTSGAGGRYAIQLTAGTWAVRIPAARFGYQPRTAVVRGGVVATQSFRIDTGIR